MNTDVAHGLATGHFGIDRFARFARRWSHRHGPIHRAGSPMSAATARPPITMFGPDFPFAYDNWVKHPAGLGRVPPERHGTEVAIVGAGIAGTPDRLRADEARPEARGLRARSPRRPPALEAVRGCRGRDCRARRHALSRLLHHLLSLSRPRRPGDQAVSQSTVAGHALHRHRSRGRDGLCREAGGSAADLPRGRAGLERGPRTGRAVLAPCRRRCAIATPPACGRSGTP